VSQNNLRAFETQFLAFLKLIIRENESESLIKIDLLSHSSSLALISNRMNNNYHLNIIA
jgi:hypothetical protein